MISITPENDAIMKEYALNIFRLYFCGSSSEFEVNVSSRTCDDTLQFIAADAPIPNDIFAKLSEQIVVNMWETWSRFCTEREYKRLSHIIKTEAELLEAK
jgi:hypothetical protein